MRFLEQATFGPTAELIAHVQEVGFESYLHEQFDAPISSYPTLPLYPTTRDTRRARAVRPASGTTTRMYPLQNRFFVNALYGPDQLRQRVAFALHQILVVSGVDITQPSWMAPYLQMLDRNAFGNYRQLLYEITLNPAMGNYLDIAGNTKTEPERELRARGPAALLDRHRPAEPRRHAAARRAPASRSRPTRRPRSTISRACSPAGDWRPRRRPGVPNYIDPMVAERGAARYRRQDAAERRRPAGRPERRRRISNDAIDNIFNDPNVGPFISKQLIQHLVTSNPSPAYVARVAAVFNGDDAGVRGDLKAVVRAILLDPEARGDAEDRRRTTAGCGIRRSSSPTCCARSTRGRRTAAAERRLPESAERV